MSFSVWLISLSIMSSMFIHIVANDRISLVFKKIFPCFLKNVNDIPFCICVCVYIYIYVHIRHIFLIHSSIDKHLVCLLWWRMFQWTREYRYLFQVTVLFPLHLYLEVGLLDPMCEKCVKVLAARLCLTAAPWTVACQAPESVELSSQEYWGGLPFLSPGELPNPGIEPGSPAVQADSLPSEPPGKPS